MEKEGSFLGSEGFFWAIIIIVIALLLIGGYYLFSYINTCDTKECFEKAITNCKRTSWTREDAEAAWTYTILSSNGKESCLLNVKLLKLNEGKIETENLVGKEMTCDFLKGSTDFPEKDISRCHGILKEEMQDMLIQRMHNYLLQNVGEISTGFKTF